MQEERRAGYVDIAGKLEELSQKLGDNTTEQAVTNANLKNVIDMFTIHLADDKATVIRVDTLAVEVSMIKGRLYGMSAATGFFGVIIGAIVGVIFHK